jgi:hypothetical protein
MPLALVLMLTLLVLFGYLLMPLFTWSILGVARAAH